MPELPEVEIVCRNLSTMICKNEKIISWVFFRSDLRFKIPKAGLHKICGLSLIKIERRAKYILFYFGDSILISHLGMTGEWRQEGSGWEPQKHDHLAFEISQNRFFVYKDPRRFGFIEVIKSRNLLERFKFLGVEPLDKKTDFKQLTLSFKKLKSPIKTALLEQKLLVGIGNIYASEILFRAGVNPLQLCFKLKNQYYDKIWIEAVCVLNEAINKGGSTIENYRNSFGNKGNFQESFFVYGRNKMACFKCHISIKSIVQAGRSTFWCPNCQKK